jgi:glycosyltransferase involved in cell wall biosynthesis
MLREEEAKTGWERERRDSPMYRSKKISVYLPCRNEADHLDKVLATIPAFVDEIIVVSNKSSDNTVQRARELGAQAIEDNRTSGGIGYGYAHMSGIDQASGDIIITADADGTYPLEQLDRILDNFMDEQLQFMSCNRYPLHRESAIPLKLRLGVWILNTEARLLYGYKIQDILSGMWVLSREAKDNLNLTMGDWNLSPEIKLNAIMHPSISFGEHHIKQHLRHGVTHQSHWKTGFSHLLWIAFYRLKLAAARAPQLQTADFDEKVI